jgi:hypothetical protein
VVSISRARGSAPFRDWAGPFCVCGSAPACVLAATEPSSGDDGFLLRLWPFVVAIRSPLAPPADRARGRVMESIVVPWGGTRFRTAAPPWSCAELYRTTRVSPGVTQASGHRQHESCRLFTAGNEPDHLLQSNGKAAATFLLWILYETTTLATKRGSGMIRALSDSDRSAVAPVQVEGDFRHD